MKNKEDNLNDEFDKTLDEALDETEVLEEDLFENSTEETDETNKIELLTSENRKLKEDFLRAYADAENTKKRCQQEIDKNNKYAISNFAKSLLGVADNLQRAIDSTDNNADCENLVKGIKLTQDELNKVFNKFGVIKMDIMGKVFDPNFHQVIQQVEDKTKPAGTIIAELQSGYMINDRILRDAMVVVTTGGK